MMEVRLVCVGRLKEPFYVAAAEEYAKRLGPFCTLKVLEVPEERLPERPSPAQVDAALKKEAGRILEKAPPGGVLTALCVEGRQLSSPQWAAQLDAWMVQGRSKLCLVIGGSFGLHESVKERARLRLSMSPMTFPHHLARVMVLEQLYRAFQINAGSAYHK
ncbi:MAG: 23S rRNA (pseudouridine(1915)-N(3))-methyltransferase RlmH [Oscillospiraceae bacterium]|nr:23S rRNA (pseudouridine(1915)-N(3))-methyltransferase RlmH [Oscillospiraceae bacterium]